MILVSLLLVSIAVLCAAYYVYRVAFYSRKKGQDDIYNIPAGEQYQPHKSDMLSLIDKIVEREYVDVYTTSFDGLKLHGRYYHVKDGAPLNIGFHGYRATALRDFCVGANESLKRGHNLLLIDQRGQGGSEGHTITMGIKEHRDVLSWVEFANEKFGSDTKIILYGVSMGAASVVMSTALDLPQNVSGVIADCPYNAPKDILLSVAKQDMGISKKLAYPFIWLAARIFGGFDVNAITCKDAVKNSKIPVLILHGEDDRYVPCEMSEEIQHANEDKVERYTFPLAGHGISFFSDKERYREITEEFFERCSKDK
ncbi:MAG: alpha/beta hydrolase [Ruminococcus sp.]|nr:alpha/beta hydrolase [Ruminococcus sp.]